MTPRILSLDLTIVRNVALLVIGGAPLACGGGRPSGQEVLDRTAPAICAKAESCASVAFRAMFMNGRPECVAVVQAEFIAKYGQAPDKTSACTDDEVDQCLDAFESSACSDAELLPRLPCSC